MRDLTDAGRSVVDSPAVPPTALDQIETRAHGRRRRGQLRAAGALGIAVVLVAGAIAIAYDRRSSPRSVTGRQHHEVTPHLDVKLRAHLGLDAPKGWSPVDYGDARLWIPPDWSVGTDCAGPLPGSVALGQAHAVSCLAQPSGTPFIAITSLAEPVGGRRQIVNGYPVYASGANKPITRWLVPALHVAIDIHGTDANRELATLGPSARVIALARAEPTPAAWHRVSYRGVSIAIPNGWPVHFMADTYSCQQFTAGSALVGTPNSAANCPYRPQDLHPQDGAFLAAPMITNRNAPGRVVGTNSDDRIRVRVLDADLGDPSPVLTVVVTIGEHAQTLEIGLGPDGRVANAILHSITREAGTGFAVPGCAPKFGNRVHNAAPGPPMVPGHPVRALLCVYDYLLGVQHLQGATYVDAALISSALNSGRGIGACPTPLPPWQAVLHFEYAEVRSPVSVVVGECATSRAGPGPGPGAVATPPWLLSTVDSVRGG